MGHCMSRWEGSVRATVCHAGREAYGPLHVTLGGKRTGHCMSRWEGSVRATACHAGREAYGPLYVTLGGKRTGHCMSRWEGSIRATVCRPDKPQYVSLVIPLSVIFLLQRNLRTGSSSVKTFLHLRDGGQGPRPTPARTSRIDQELVHT